MSKLKKKKKFTDNKIKVTQIQEFVPSCSPFSTMFSMGFFPTVLYLYYGHNLKLPPAESCGFLKLHYTSRFFTNRCEWS